MKTIFDISPRDRHELFMQTALKKGIGQANIIEKDYWLTKTLQLLFDDQEFYANHVFKGGTSLSKCFNLIERFSEDVDITISKQHLNFNETIDEIKTLSNKKRKQYFDQLDKATIAHVDHIAKRLASKMEHIAHNKKWNIYLSQNDPKTIIFEYPRSLIESMYSDIAYIWPRILLEFGCRGETIPSTKKVITTYCEEMFPDIFDHSIVAVNTMCATRTFWEKVTLLHMLANQDTQKTLAPRMARHYYDTYKLSLSDTLKEAQNNISLLSSVAQHKSIYFRSKQACYEAAQPGTLKIYPSESLLIPLKADYSAMMEMFYGDIIPFEVILTKLKNVEHQINTLNLQS